MFQIPRAPPKTINSISIFPSMRILLSLLTILSSIQILLTIRIIASKHPIQDSVSIRTSISTKHGLTTPWKNNEISHRLSTISFDDRILSVQQQQSTVVRSASRNHQKLSTPLENTKEHYERAIAILPIPLHFKTKPKPLFAQSMPLAALNLS